jgi:hypothetical protein
MLTDEAATEPVRSYLRSLCAWRGIELGGLED